MVHSASDKQMVQGRYHIIRFFYQISGLHNILDSLMPEGLAVVTFWSFRLLMGRKGGEEEGEVDAQMIYTFTPVADDDDSVTCISLIL